MTLTGECVVMFFTACKLVGQKNTLALYTNYSLLSYYSWLVSKLNLRYILIHSNSQAHNKLLELKHRHAIYGGDSGLPSDLTLKAWIRWQKIQWLQNSPSPLPSSTALCIAAYTTLHCTTQHYTKLNCTKHETKLHYTIFLLQPGLAQIPDSLLTTGEQLFVPALVVHSCPGDFSYEVYLQAKSSEYQNLDRI